MILLGPLPKPAPLGELEVEILIVLQHSFETKVFNRPSAGGRAELTAQFLAASEPLQPLGQAFHVDESALPGIERNGEGLTLVPVSPAEIADLVARSERVLVFQ